MAVELAQVPASTEKQSIARVEFFVEEPRIQADYELKAHFGNGLYDQNGELLPNSYTFGTRVVSRRLGVIQSDMHTFTDPVTGLEHTISSAGIAAAIQVGCYTYREEDVAAEQAAPPEEPEGE